MKNKSLLTLIFVALLGAAAVQAQPVSGMNAAKRLQIAEDKMKIGDLYNALDWFEKAYEDDPTSVNVMGKIAQLNYRLRDFKKAESWFSRTITADTKGTIPDARFFFARVLKMNGKYDKAVAEFQQFIADYKGDNMGLKKLAANELLGAEMGRELKDDPSIAVNNAGNKINTSFSEFSPIPVGNEEVYWGSIRSDSVIVLDDKKNDFYAQIYSAKRAEKGFTEATPLSGNINKTGFHTGNMSISDDKNTMYFTRCVLQNNVLAHCDIFVSKRSGSDWAEATKVNGVNTDASTSKQPAIGKVDGKDGLFFVSDRPGGQGGWDLYYAQQLADGSFATPLNLGDKVNTVGNEETPFFNKNTLYFSSDGQPTIGGYDVFSATGSGGNWDVPRNMGKGVNSGVDDMYFTIAANGYQGFLVSNRKGTTSLKSETCCDDIWTVDMPFTSNLLATTVDRDSKQPLNGVTIRLIEVPTPSATKLSKTNPAGNDFTFDKLPTEKRWKAIASTKGYYNDSTEITTVGLKKPTDMSHIFKLVKLLPPPPIIPVKPKEPPVEIISLHNIYWDFDKYNVRGDAARTLDTIINILKSKPDLMVEVGSHTDALGSNNYNEGLSDRRSKAAVDFMQKAGVKAEQLVPAHFGEEAPAAPNDNEVNRQRNRRTEFHVIRRAMTTSLPASGSTETVHNGMQAVEYNAETKKKLENVAHIAFIGGNKHDFGKLKKGQKVSHTFEFMNDGKAPLIIEFASGGCDCTKVDEYPKGAIPVGGKGSIKLTFDTTEKGLGAAKGDANVIANTDPIVSEILISATVEK